jgi:hypothetical protein
MNSKHTLIWFVVAVALFGFILVYQFIQRSSRPETPEILPGLHTFAVTSVQIFPNNAHEIIVERTNDDWVMTEPVFYPAQKAAVEGLLDAMKKLTAATRINGGGNQSADAEYGFKTPETIVIQSGDDRHEILVGDKTAPGDQVFLRVVGSEGVFVTDSSWLKFIPQSANDWRDTALVSGAGDYDSITLTNGAEIIELHSNPTNHLWQMTRPLAARANSDYIVKALQQLQTARVSQFVTDSSGADLTGYGLQPADLDLWLGHGTNFDSVIHFGKSTTNDSAQIFAKREHWNSVVMTSKQPLSPWYGAVNDFRDPYLVELTAPVAEIEMIGPDTNHFVLQRQDATTWKIPGETFPVDPGMVQYLIQTLAGMRVSGFEKDVVTPADLASHGLAKPWRQIILRSAIGDTNAVIAHLLFGNVYTNEVFIQRSDEAFIYAISPEDFTKLPEGPAWQLRDRRIWNFSETNVTQVTIRQKGKTLQLIHNGPNQWSVAAGSQGVVNPPGVEETVHDLGNLDADAWMARGATIPPGFGFKPDNLSLTLTLKNGQSYQVDFGAPLAGQTFYSYAAVTLDGQRWVFLFDAALYQMVSSYLTIPSNVP